jgi:hypothetical protein
MLMSDLADLKVQFSGQGGRTNYLMGVRYRESGG